jgi:plastocyanin
MKTKRFISITLLAISTAIFAMAFHKSNNPNKNGRGSYTVSMQNSSFSPSSLTIPAGSTVTWMNDDNVIHAVRTADTSINTGDIAPTSSYSIKFNTARTFNYYDARNTNMTGTLIVTSAGAKGNN